MNPDSTMYSSLMHNTDYYNNYNESVITDEIINVCDTSNIFHSFMNIVYPELKNETKSITNFSSYEEQYGNYKFTFENNTFNFNKTIKKKFKYFNTNYSNGELKQEGTYERIVKLKYSGQGMRNVGITYNNNGVVCKPTSVNRIYQTKHNLFGKDTMKYYIMEVGTFEKHTYFDCIGKGYIIKTM